LSAPRIIAGKARGIRLQDVPGDITRPITDRVKEALFNILGVDIQEASLLDLFGGTGSVGLEALSRGASYVRFIDLHRAAIQTIRTNIERTRLNQGAEVLQTDAFAHLRQRPDRAFDFIFIAPPQYKGLWVQAMQALESQPAWLHPQGWIIVQIDPVEYQSVESAHFVEIDQRRYGSTLLVFYETIQSPPQTSP